jgi:hypothetical protein
MAISSRALQTAAQFGMSLSGKIASPTQILRNLNTVALPAIALAAASQVRGAEAFGLSKISCAICLAASLTTAGASALACILPCTIAAVTIPVPGF